MLLFLLSCQYGLQSVGDVVQGKVPDDSGFAPVDDAPLDMDLSGRLYSIAPGDFQVKEPEGLEAVKTQLFSKNILVYVVDQAGKRLQMAMALAGDDGQQNHCEVVRNLPVADWSDNPAFVVGPGDVSTTFGGNPATFYDFQLYGVFAQDANTWDRGDLSAHLDLRELQNSVPGADCTVVESYGGNCVPCADGEVQCFNLRMDGFKARYLEAPFDSRETGDCQ